MLASNVFQSQKAFKEEAFGRAIATHIASTAGECVGSVASIQGGEGLGVIFSTKCHIQEESLRELDTDIWDAYRDTQHSSCYSEE